MKKPRRPRVIWVQQKPDGNLELSSAHSMHLDAEPLLLVSEHKEGWRNIQFREVLPKRRKKGRK